jgi:hypothetical protein
MLLNCCYYKSHQTNGRNKKYILFSLCCKTQDKTDSCSTMVVALKHGKECVWWNTVMEQETNLLLVNISLTQAIWHFCYSQVPIFSNTFSFPWNGGLYNAEARPEWDSSSTDIHSPVFLGLNQNSKACTLLIYAHNCEFQHISWAYMKAHTSRRTFPDIVVWFVCATWCLYAIPPFQELYYQTKCWLQQ